MPCCTWASGRSTVRASTAPWATSSTTALVTSKPAKPTSGSTRHVYTLTDLGHRALAQWMRVIEAERDGLVRVTARYAGLGGAEGRARPP